MPGFDIGSVIGSVADTAMSLYQTNAAQNMQWNAQNFLEGQRATAYQTAVGDMRAAGLNPAMMYDRGGGGAAVVGAGTGSLPSAARPGAGLMENQVNSAQAELLSAQAAKVRAETPTSGNLGDVNLAVLSQSIAESVSRIQNLSAQSTREYATADQARQNIENMKAMLPQIKAATTQLISLAQLNDAQRQEQLTRAGLNMAEVAEVNQRLRENLPALQRQLMDIERIEGQARQPSALNDANVQDGFLGTLGSVLRTLNPFNSYFRSSTGGTTVNKSYTNIIRK